MPDSLSDEHVSPTVTASEVVLDGAVWNVARETFELDGASIRREFVDHPGAVAVVALDERGRMLVIKQYRHPVRARDWELPAGLLDAHGESPLDAAKRELAEEVDLVAESWDLLSEFTSSPGGSNEVIRIYLARGVSAAAETFERTEEEAGIEVRWVPLDEVVDAVLSRTVHNSILAIGALSAAAGQARGWSNLGAADAAWPSHPSAN
jgi:8-oxo-dGTP pyrophosphatase MutT (NUDIX family)